MDLRGALGFSFADHEARHDVPAVDWVIVGGESGPGARITDVADVRAVVHQCRESGVPVFVKQLGAVQKIGSTVNPWPTSSGRLRDRKGGDPAEWPEDLRVREFPKEIR